MYAFRVIVDSVDDAYRALGTIHNVHKPIGKRFKDYIAIPKSNGYQAIHTSLIALDGVPIEVQIQTKEHGNYSLKLGFQLIGHTKQKIKFAQTQLELKNG